MGELFERVVRGHWWLVLGGCLTGALLAPLLHLAEEPDYLARARIQVATPRTGTVASAALVTAWSAATATSERLVGEAVRRAAVARDPRTVASEQVTVDRVADSPVVDLYVRDRQPLVATALAREIAQGLVLRVNAELGPAPQPFGPPALVVDPPTAGPTPVRTPLGIWLATAAAAGLLTGLLAATALEMARPTTRRPNGLARRLGAPLLGTVSGPPDEERIAELTVVALLAARHRRCQVVVVTPVDQESRQTAIAVATRLRAEATGSGGTPEPEIRVVDQLAQAVWLEDSCCLLLVGSVPARLSRLAYLAELVALARCPCVGLVAVC